MRGTGGLAVGELAPPLELPDTEGALHTLPMPGEVPATVVVWTCNHCPYALAWHDRIVAVHDDYAGSGVRFLHVNSNDAERYPHDSLEAMRERVEAEREQFVGSPTIRIDGRDVQPPGSDPVGLTCRVYRRPDGRISALPDRADVREALARAAATEGEAE